jgi:hypothetical protein
MSTIIKPEDVRPGDVINVVYERDGHGVQTSDNFTVVKVEGDQLYFGDGRYDFMNLALCDTVDHIELVDRPKPVIKVGNRVRHTTGYGTVFEFDVHHIRDGYAYPRDLYFTGRRLEDLELVTEQ